MNENKYNYDITKLDFDILPLGTRTPVAKAIKLYSKGTSIKKCAKKVGISRYRLSRYFKKMGIATDQFQAQPIPVRVTLFDEETGEPHVRMFPSRIDASREMNVSIRTVYYKIAEGSATRDGHLMGSAVNVPEEEERPSLIPGVVTSTWQLILGLVKPAVQSTIEYDKTRPVILESIWGIKMGKGRRYGNAKLASVKLDISVGDVLTSANNDVPVTDMRYQFRWAEPKN